MSTLLWVIAGLDLLGGIVLAVEMESFVWIMAGIVMFAMIGGFATVISLLSDIHGKIPSLKHLESSQIEMNEKLKQVNEKLKELTGSVEQLKYEIRKSDSKTVPSSSTKPAVVNTVFEANSGAEKKGESLSNPTTTKGPEENIGDIPLDNGIRDQVVSELNYAVNLSSSSRVRSIIKNLYENTKYEPISMLLSLSDDELKPAVKDLLSKL